MNIREAILRAADSVEQNPGRFSFYSTDLPDDCGTPACALGWIAYHIGEPIGVALCERTAEAIGCTPDPVFSNPRALGAVQLEFYARMDSVTRHDWRENAGECAKALRMFADKYHPAPKTAIPKSVYWTYSGLRKRRK